MKIAIAIATTGRIQVLSDTINFLRQQTRAADALYICPASDADLDPTCLDNFPCRTEIIKGARGSSSQRNAILRQMNGEDVVVFLDDDFLPEPYFLEELESLFISNADVVVATGHVVADGIKSRGIEFEEAMAILNTLPERPAATLIDTYAGYGCNLAVRTSVIKAENVFFDEVLPLYAWWEDVDLSRRLSPFGRIVNFNRMRGVHQGTKKGRTPGKRLGYSQVCNLIYLNRKGSIDGSMTIRQISRNMLANLARSFYPEPWVDRRGRFLGNLLALSDAARGHVDPQRILKM
jgi:GT2 family glycosyltransferase